ncbi:MAG: Fic family protein [Oscillospiraceae bacterium]|nr:Fic family protein [Oscillospiraceae bacterium]
MQYISTKAASEKWSITEQLIRRYCRQERIPGAIQKEGAWLIPEDAKKPAKIEPMEKEVPELPPLAKKLIRQKKKKNFHGLYDYVQTDLTYSSSRMASNRLTRGQVETIFKKGKVSVSFEPMKVSDLVEVLNHCVCVDYILDHVEEPLSQKFIKHLHYQLTFGTVDERRKKVTPGQYRTKNSYRTEPFMSPSDRISDKLKALIAEYESLEEVDRREILDFHVRFERIFPFEDCNGRIGRLIMFKECLRYEVMPFILDDKRRSRYLEGIREWDDDPGILSEVVMEAQSRFDAQIQLQNLAEHRQSFQMIGFMEDEL